MPFRNENISDNLMQYITLKMAENYHILLNTHYNTEI